MASVYKMLVDQDAMYGKKIRLPRPEFYVLYNGTEDLADETTLNLSDLFEKVEGHEGIELELKVRVYNINDGRNEWLLGKSEALKGYAIFVEQVREGCEEEGGLRGISEEERKVRLGRGIKRAMEYCIKHNILREFIERNSGEVINMLTTEFEIEAAERVWKEMAWEAGMEKGREEGMELGVKKNKAEVLELMAHVESMEEFEQLRASLQAAVSGDLT